MTERKTLRRYIYEENEKEIVEWAKAQIKEQRMQEKTPNGKANFPFYLQQYLNHLRFESRK
jgi:hypothetical protein